MSPKPTPLHEAESVEVARALVVVGARLNVRDQHGRTPLHCAVVDGRWEVAIFLVELSRERYLHLNARDDKGRTPLHWAAIKDDGVTARALLSLVGTKQHLKDNDGNTALRLAMTHGAVDFVCAFLRAGMVGAR